MRSSEWIVFGNARSHRRDALWSNLRAFVVVLGSSSCLLKCSVIFDFAALQAFDFLAVQVDGHPAVFVFPRK